MSELTREGAFSLHVSLARAETRFRASSRRRRADAGRSRLSPKVEAKLLELLVLHDPPNVLDIHRELSSFCKRARIRSPSRATIYNAMDRVPAPTYEYRTLPVDIQRCLHNVADGQIPGAQVVFAAMNYGETRALSFAAGMPWPCLHRAAKLPGFRPKSLSLLRAIMAHRGL